MKPYKLERLIKRGRRKYGAIYQLCGSGKRLYLAYRSNSEIFRFGELSCSDAIRKGKAAWALDEHTLIILKAEGVKVVGVLERNDGDVYLTHIQNFFDNSKVLNYSSRGGALQRYLGFENFTKRSGTSLRA